MTETLDKVTRWVGATSAILLGIAIVACTQPTQPSPSEMVPGESGVVPPSEMRLSINNGTTLDVLLVVNGQLAGTFAAGSANTAGIPASELPPLPWNVEIRTSRGRLLVSLVVHAGDVRSGRTNNGGTVQQGAGARVDLSCGRLDVWSGPPLAGPAPGTGRPGDCVP